MIGKAFNVLMQSELVGKALQHEALVEAILRAVTSSLEARDVLSAHYEQLLTQVGLVTARQLDELHAELDLFKQEAEGLREQLDVAAQTTRKLRQRAEGAEKELSEAREAVNVLQAELEKFKDNQTSAEADSAGTAADEAEDVDVAWRPTMTKAELIEVASELGMSVSKRLRKSELIERLRSLGGQ